MNRNLFFLLFACLGFFSCSDDFLSDTGNIDPYQHQGNKFTVSEAKQLFESYATTLPTRSGALKRQGKLDPGLVSPQWEKAMESQDNRQGSVDIPIQTSFRYQVKRSEAAHKGRQAYTVSVYQKLVVVKEWETSQQGIYIQTIIPDKMYAKKHKKSLETLFLNSSDRKDFSGMLVYTDLRGGIPIRISRYESGKLTDGIYLFNKQHDFQTTLNKINSMLSGLKIRYALPLTRSLVSTEDDGGAWGEDSDEWWYHTEGDSYTNDDGITCWDAQDSNGNHYMVGDMNGDGQPDTLMGDSSTANPDGGGSGDIWNGGGGGSESGGSSGGGNTGGGGGGGGGSSGGSYPRPIPDPDLTIPIGKDYYQRRIEDFKRRYPDLEPPSYYKDYAEFYMNRFTTETRPILSEAGQKWVDKTMKLLQEAITKILKDNHYIEKEPDRFMKAAFKSHVQAYIDGGILTLSMTDKVDILLTVYPEDLLSPLGIEQAKAVAIKQFEYYNKYPAFKYEQYCEFMLKYPIYTAKVIKYASNSRKPNTRSATTISTMDVYNVVLGDFVEYFEAQYGVHFERPANN